MPGELRLMQVIFAFHANVCSNFDCFIFFFRKPTFMNLTKQKDEC